MPIEINLKARCLSPNRPSEAATARLFFNCKVTDETYSEIQHLTRNYSGDTADFRFFIDKMHKTTKNEVFYVATIDHQCTRHNVTSGKLHTTQRYINFANECKQQSIDNTTSKYVCNIPEILLSSSILIGFQSTLLFIGLLLIW
uniref:CPXV099 protein n=1 Tax=Bursaphelenchus xylophilus TaxID=6326 RepID=A0A1I7SVK2_BURXY